MKTKNFFHIQLSHPSGLKRWLLLPLCCLFFTSCKKYLDAKPDKTLAVPSTLQDFQAILDNNFLNLDYPFAGDIGSDDYFLKASDLSNFSTNIQLTYVWNANAANDLDYNYGYNMIERCNVVLDGLAKTGLQSSESIKGSALFLRGYIFFQLANIFSLPYDMQNSNNIPGIPLRLSADITVKTTRSSMQETYQQIISDLQSSLPLLPVQPMVKTRPSRPAAYGVLARTYLAMGDYANANKYADSCLQLYSKLMDYNTLDNTLSNPISQFNDEVIFHATTSGREGVLNPYYARVDTSLYASYTSNDLRKNIFYTSAGDGYYGFKGDYTGQSYGSLFNGIAVDEILLVRSETYARLGNNSGAIADLNLLLSKRYSKSGFTPYPNNYANLLQLILQERRKELAFRSEIRWSDLRRLNKDPQYAKSLTRAINGQTYTLPPNDKRYAWLIPVSVIQQSGILQNDR
ncbi:MAG: RagB/SusD family nutrient uptake outer membrane protein [Chitinophagaceae bacterium]|nr:RagB/SusD family nutrient uptake outer membrane protein [Chitinophagaceae bacterium]